MSKQKRRGKVFIDWSQNAAHKSTVCVYSMRAKKERPFISMPIPWEDIERSLARNDPGVFEVEPDEAVRRCQASGDLFAPVLDLKQKLARDWRKAAGKLAGLSPYSHSPRSACTGSSREARQAGIIPAMRPTRINIELEMRTAEKDIAR
jgi:bifunctional non-homologous end joining protein LigD